MGFGASLGFGFRRAFSLSFGVCSGSNGLWPVSCSVIMQPGGECNCPTLTSGQ